MNRREFLKGAGAVVLATTAAGLPTTPLAKTRRKGVAPYRFPKDLYADVRIENTFETLISYRLGELQNLRERRVNAAFLRVYDGRRWYYGAVGDLGQVQEELDGLAALARPSSTIGEDPIVARAQVNRGSHLTTAAADVSRLPRKRKTALLQGYFPLLQASPHLKMWQAMYLDKRCVKRFLSSKGSDLEFDSQSAGLAISMSFKDGERSLDSAWDVGRNRFADILRQERDFKDRLRACEHFLERATPVKPGKYTVILSPLAAGIFAHESFGHKSEADLMIGDKMMMKEWTIGKRVGSPLLSIVDSGLLDGVGHVPFDDEGTRATKSYLVKKGILAGRLHSTKTATLLKEPLTGNARAVSFQFEPIVRMTTTYIEPGDKTKAELIAEVKDGLLVETIKHGSGMSTFTLAPSLAYRIKDGKVTEPVQIAVVSGSVFETLGLVDGVSNKLELLSFVRGGCGKMDQAPLPVGFGGPYVRVKSLDVQ